MTKDIKEFDKNRSHDELVMMRHMDRRLITSLREDNTELEEEIARLKEPVDVEALKMDEGGYRYAESENYAEGYNQAIDDLNSRGLIRGCEWRDIESAPKDGSYFLAMNKNNLPAVCHWDKMDWVSEEESPCVFPMKDAVKWAPLPQPPKGQDDE